MFKQVKEKRITFVMDMKLFSDFQKIIFKED